MRTMLSMRSWRLPLFLAATLLIAIPLWRMRDHDTAEYYQEIVDTVSGYFVHENAIYNNTLYQDGTETAVHAQYNFSLPCEGFPNTDGIMLVMKTGASESFQKLPTQLLTSLQCLPDFLLFSDLEQQIGKYHLQNVLDRVDEKVKNKHHEFNLYQAQLDCPISQEECTKDIGGGWDLDKYKFLNMIERTWEQRPNMDWYVFAEADTYVVWSNLVHWLRQRAPSGDLYVGSVAMLNDFPFAHGGSGYVISGSQLKKMAENIPDVAAKYDEKAGGECCGDLLISQAVDETGGNVKQAHPMFNGEKPNTIPYGPNQWCEPILTMHHMNPEEVSAVWQYEQTRTDKDTIVQIKDLYQAFMAPHLNSYRKDWDNLSDDTCFLAPDEESQKQAGDHEKSRQRKHEDKSAVEKHAHESAAACARVCEADKLGYSNEEYEALEGDGQRGKFLRDKYDEKAGDERWKKDRSCFQWRYHHGACCTSGSFKLGRPRREEKNEDTWYSGWFVKGINDWIESRGECKGVEWKTPG